MFDRICDQMEVVTGLIEGELTPEYVEAIESIMKSNTRSLCCLSGMLGIACEL